MITGAGSSWLARGDKRTSLCYNGKNWQGANETVCKPVPYAKGIDGYAIRMTRTKSGLQVFSFARKPGTQASPHEMTYAKNFMVGLLTTSKALQQIANRRQPVSTAPGTPNRASLSVGAGGSGCGFDDVGGGFCYLTPDKPTGASIISRMSDDGGDDGTGDPGSFGGFGDLGGIGSGAFGGVGNDNPFGDGGWASNPGGAVGEIPLGAILTPDWPSGYPNSEDESGPLGDSAYDGGGVEYASEQGSVTAVLVCLPSPVGPPLCSTIPVVNIPPPHFTTPKWISSFFDYANILWRDTGGGPWGDDGDTERDRKRAECGAKFTSARLVCDAKHTDATDKDIIEKYRACMKPALEALRKCYQDNP